MILQIILAVIIGYIIIRKLSRRKFTNYPPSVQALWLPGVGHALGFGNDPVDFLMKQQKKLGPVFSFELFGRDCVFLGDTESYDAFYKSPDEVLSAREAYKFTIPAFGRGVVYDVEHKVFKEQRRMTHATLTLKQFRTFVPLMEAEVIAYLDEFWKNQGTTEFYRTISEIVMRTSTRCLQGDDVRGILRDGYVDWMGDIDASLSIFSFFFPNFPLPSFRKRDLARKKIGEIFKGIIRDRVQKGQSPDDFIEIMRNKTYENGAKMTEDEIAGLSVALMLAGYHTSNITTTWVIIHILSNPDLLNAVLEELENTASSDDPLDYDKIEKMKLLKGCMSESLRLRPPIILIWRKVMKDLKIKSYVVPAGSFVCVSPAARHLDPAIFPEPEKYDPKRFVDLDSKDNYGYLPFSTGEHYCIGEKFAYLQVRTILATILRRYDLKLKGTSKDYPVDNTTMMAGPVKPVTVSFVKKK